MKKLRLALIAPPWLPIPPVGYGGIENVLAYLIPELIKLNVDVELFTIGESEIKSNRNHWLYKESQYGYIHKPLYESIPIATAHSAFAINRILEDSHFDIVHSHNGFIDPFVFNFIQSDFPPVIHTLHGPPFTTPDRLELGLPDNLPMWEQLYNSPKLYYVPISEALAKFAPQNLKSHFLTPIHNGVDPNDFPFVENKSDYFISLARIHPDKGQSIAIKSCLKAKAKLLLAGPLGDIKDSKSAIDLVLKADIQALQLPVFSYFKNEILPYLDGNKIQYLGDVGSVKKLKLISEAKALLFPIQWDEPFGMAPIEALACGTPVISMNKGALPEIIEHGKNGFLANSLEEFEFYLRLVDQIDPRDCRKSVETKFSGSIMAQKYLATYLEVIDNIKHSALKISL